MLLQWASQAVLVVKWSEVKLLSRVRFFATPWTVAYQAPPSMGFSRQEYWSELPFPSPGDLPDPGIEPGSPAFQADALTSEPPVVKSPFASAGDMICGFHAWIRKIPESGRGLGNPLQDSCLENPMDRDPGSLWFIGSQRVGHDRNDLTCNTHKISPVPFIMKIPVSHFVDI